MGTEPISTPGYLSRQPGVEIAGPKSR